MSPHYRLRFNPICFLQSSTSISNQSYFFPQVHVSQTSCKSFNLLSSFISIYLSSFYLFRSFLSHDYPIFSHLYVFQFYIIKVPFILVSSIQFFIFLSKCHCISHLHSYLATSLQTCLLFLNLASNFSFMISMISFPSFHPIFLSYAV